MSLGQKVAMLVVCVIIFILVFDLVRRRKLREEYSWLWLLTSLALFLLVIKFDWLVFLTKIIGAVDPTSTLFIGALIFLLILCIQFSVKISRLTDQVKNLVQENGLLRGKVEEIAENFGPNLPSRLRVKESQPTKTILTDRK